MTNPSRKGYAAECLIDSSAGSNQAAPDLDSYLLQSGQKLAAITDSLNCGEEVGDDLHAWMLAQVDFIVQVVSEDGLKLSDEIHTGLLQFLLSVANLNEQLRHRASLRR